MDPEPLLLRPGTLEAALGAARTRGLASGALVPIATESLELPQAAIPFLVRILGRKDSKERLRAAPARDASNPFLPCDPDLLVAELSPTHRAVLNKFPVIDLHLLVVTRHWEDQEASLRREDFEALLACLFEIDGLGFYNAGPVAGASQAHKHLQLVRTPLGPACPGRTPIDGAVAGARFTGGIGRIDLFPFRHALAHLEGLLDLELRSAAERCLARYGELLDHVGCAGGRLPYNLLMTRDWMLALPRSRDSHAGIQVNALGYAGCLLVRDREQLRTLERMGPLALLREVGEPAR